jgi:chromosome segregation ATPase
MSDSEEIKRLTQSFWHVASKLDKLIDTLNEQKKQEETEPDDEEDDDELGVMHFRLENLGEYSRMTRRKLEELERGLSEALARVTSLSSADRARATYTDERIRSLELGTSPASVNAVETLMGQVEQITKRLVQVEAHCNMPPDFDLRDMNERLRRVEGQWLPIPARHLMAPGEGWNSLAESVRVMQRAVSERLTRLEGQVIFAKPKESGEQLIGAIRRDIEEHQRNISKIDEMLLANGDDINQHEQLIKSVQTRVVHSNELFDGLLDAWTKFEKEMRARHQTQDEKVRNLNEYSAALSRRIEKLEKIWTPPEPKEPT